jgi:hypothetical protein
MRLQCSGLLDSTSTPPNEDIGGMFGYTADNGDLLDSRDYRNTGDPYFDEVTRLEEHALDALIDAAGEKHQYFDTP